MNNKPPCTGKLIHLTLENAMLSSHGISAAKIRAFHRWVLETHRDRSVERLLSLERRAELRMLLQKPADEEADILLDEWYFLCGRIGEVEEDLLLLDGYYLNAAIDRYECTLEMRNPAIGRLWPMFEADSGLIEEAPGVPPI